MILESLRDRYFAVRVGFCVNSDIWWPLGAVHHRGVWFMLDTNNSLKPAAETSALGSTEQHR